MQVQGLTSKALNSYESGSTLAYFSTGVPSISRRTMSSGLMPSASALKLVMMRMPQHRGGHGAHVFASTRR